MADSNITKRALATALKELIETVPFQKIGVGDICERCEMNRKSFYYHFKDKEDLANWIFDIEFLEIASKKEYDSELDVLEDLVRYFYDNRSFYRRLLRHDGQNSFSEHFHELIYPVLVERLQAILGNTKAMEFQVNFLADGVVCFLNRWLTANDCTPPEDFIKDVKPCIYTISKHICDKFDNEEK